MISAGFFLLLIFNFFNLFEAVSYPLFILGPPWGFEKTVSSAQFD